MTTLQRLFSFSAAGGRELRLKARPPARFISHPNTEKHIHTTEPKHEPETAHPLRVPRCLLSVSQRGYSSSSSSVLYDVGHWMLDVAWSFVIGIRTSFVLVIRH